MGLNKIGKEWVKMSEEKSKGGVKGIVILIIVAVAAICIIWALNTFLDRDDDRRKQNNIVENIEESVNSANGLGGFATEEIDFSQFHDVDDDIKNAYEILDNNHNVNGYLVHVGSEDQNGKMLLGVSFDKGGRTIKDITLKKYSGRKDLVNTTAVEDFYKELRGKDAPISLREDTIKTDDSIYEGIVDGINDAFEFVYENITVK